MKEKDDIAIERVREIRHKISAEFGHDPKRLVDHYIELQKQYDERLEPTQSETRGPATVVTK